MCKGVGRHKEEGAHRKGMCCYTHMYTEYMSIRHDHNFISKLSATKACFHVVFCVGLSDDFWNTEVQVYILSIKKRSLANAILLHVFRISLLSISNLL